MGTPSHLGHMDRVAATLPSQAHAGAAQEAPDIGQWEGQDVSPPHAQGMPFPEVPQLQVKPKSTEVQPQTNAHAQTLQASVANVAGPTKPTKEALAWIRSRHKEKQSHPEKGREKVRSHGVDTRARCSAEGDVGVAETKKMIADMITQDEANEKDEKERDKEKRRAEEQKRAKEAEEKTEQERQDRKHRAEERTGHEEKSKKVWATIRRWCKVRSIWMNLHCIPCIILPHASTSTQHRCNMAGTLITSLSCPQGNPSKQEVPTQKALPDDVNEKLLDEIVQIKDGQEVHHV